MKLSYNNLISLAKGASVMTTGGGLCLADQLDSIAKHRNISLELLTLADFSPDDILVTASEVGTADAKEMEKAGILPKMLAVWEKMTGLTIAGVYAPELGQESIIIDTALGLGVPLVDFDVAGGRAVPFVDINSFHASGMDFSMAPLVVATDMGDIISATTQMSMDKTERFLRPLVELSQGGVVYFIGGAVRVRDVIAAGVENRSLSRAIKIGEATSLGSIETLLAPTQSWHGRITGVTNITRAGFNCSEAQFETVTGDKFTLFILNEVLFVRDDNGQNLVAPPDKIFIVNPQSLTGVATKDLLAGSNVILYTVPADKIWATEVGCTLFGPKRFIPES